MEYKDLKELIKHLKSNVKCPNCEKSFTDNDITIVATMESEAVFQLACSKCENLMVVNVSMKSHFERGNAITINDVIEMHNFLEKFNGDFKQLFKLSK